VNNLLLRRDLFSKDDFRGVDLPEDALRLASLNPEDLFDYEVQRLNRHLLTAAYPDTLRPPNTVNSLGFFSPELRTTNGPNEFRIAMLGGSTVFCAPTRDTALAAQLARALEERFKWARAKELTYINAGLPSGVSGQELAQFVYHVLPLEVDLLVVLDGFNDVELGLAYDCRAGYPYDYVVQEYRYGMFT